jgi:hypothetical protein
MRSLARACWRRLGLVVSRMDRDERQLLEAVAAALKRGQKECSEDQLQRAFEQVRASQIGGMMAGLVREGRADLTLEDGTLRYVARPGTPGRPLDRDALRVALGREERDAIADEYGGVVALDVHPMELGPLGLIVEKLPGDVVEGEGRAADAIRYTLINLEDGDTVVSFAVLFDDLSRLISEAPVPDEGG